MIFCIFLLVVIVLLLVQTTILEIFSLGGVTPDLALIFVVYCGVHFQRSGGIGAGVIVGFVQDCLSGGLLGINTLSKGLAGLFFSVLKDKIVVEGFIPISFFLFSASLVDGMIYFIVSSSLTAAQIKEGLLLFHMFVFGIYNSAVGLLLFYLLDKGRQWINHKIPNQVLRPL
ncbi:MAG: rod shape-determining protein MreD [Desulfobacterales bacterium]|jgi:rod shape-determining protein MreD|nr:rod shape-determining protein MreD [Desulfobacterales bacterium]